MRPLLLLPLGLCVAACATTSVAPVGLATERLTLRASEAGGSYGSERSFTAIGEAAACAAAPCSDMRLRLTANAPPRLLFRGSDVSLVVDGRRFPLALDLAGTAGSPNDVGRSGLLFSVVVTPAAFEMLATARDAQLLYGSMEFPIGQAQRQAFAALYNRMRGSAR